MRVALRPRAPTALSVPPLGLLLLRPFDPSRSSSARCPPPSSSCRTHVSVFAWVLITRRSLAVCGPVPPGAGYPVASQTCPLGCLAGSSALARPGWTPRPSLGLHVSLGAVSQDRGGHFGGHLQLCCHPAPATALYPPRASVTSLEFVVFSLSPGLPPRFGGLSQLPFVDGLPDHPNHS